MRIAAPVATSLVLYVLLGLLRPEPGIASGIGSIPFSGVFFSTFYGGHDTSWGPKTTQHSYFADFSLSKTVQH